MNWVSLDEMPELIKTYARGEHYFGVVRKLLDGIGKNYEFGITEEGHQCLKKILDYQPFDKMPGTRYQYYFMNSIGSCNDKREYSIQVMIVQGSKQKSFKFRVPQVLMNNLQWFGEIQSEEELSNLVVID